VHVVRKDVRKDVCKVVHPNGEGHAEIVGDKRCHAEGAVGAPFLLVFYAIHTCILKRQGAQSSRVQNTLSAYKQSHSNLCRTFTAHCKECREAHSSHASVNELFNTQHVYEIALALVASLYN
jgi:hypothetical protein